MHTAAPAAIRDIVTRLRHSTADGRDVPPDVAADLTALKHSLRDLISETVGAPGAVDVAPNELADRVVAQLEAEDVPVGDEGGYGVITSIKLARPKEYTAWLVASVSLAVPYGNDTSLYVFQIRQDSWHLALAVETNGYGSIAGAQGWLAYRVGRSLEGEIPFLVATDLTPSDVSVWQSLRLRVLQVGRSPDHPRRLATRSLSYCIEVPYWVSIRDGGLALIYQGENVYPGIAGDRGIHYLDYSVKAGVATLVREAAIDPSGFVSRWVRRDWAAASASIDPAARSVTREWHERLRKPELECDLSYLQMGLRAEGGHEQLLAAAGCRLGANEKPEVHVVFRADSRGFRIVSVSPERPDWSEDSGFEVWNQDDAGVTAPIAEHTVQPALPASFAAEPVKMRVSVVVKSDGSVGTVQLIDWPDQPGLVIPAIHAARQWRFKPATLDGRPVNVAKFIDIVFTPSH
jgi:hypothetical protein